MATELGVADEFVFREIDRWRRGWVTHRWKVIAPRMPAPTVISFL